MSRNHWNFYNLWNMTVNLIWCSGNIVPILLVLLTWLCLDSLQKQPFADVLGKYLFLKFRKIHLKTTILGSLFNTVASLKHTSWLKRDTSTSVFRWILWHFSTFLILRHFIIPSFSRFNPYVATYPSFQRWNHRNNFFWFNQICS